MNLEVIILIAVFFAKTAICNAQVTGEPLDQNRVYFKATCDFKEQKDIAQFYYSLDGKKWHTIGDPMKMPYTLPHFMGYRFGLFNYATEQIGGYAEFDYFGITNSIK